MEELKDFDGYLKNKKRILVKVGSQVLLNKEGRLSSASFGKICGFVSSLISLGKEVIIVSSGAVAAGKELVGIGPEHSAFTMPQKQAFAACGQPALMKHYSSCFKKYGINAAQILLTRDDISVRKRFANARNTIYELLKNGVVPIINENDTVSFEEIKFSDNDHLSALVLDLVCADMFIILSNVGGVYDKNPALNSDARLVSFIGDIGDYMKNFSDTGKSMHGTGGMKSKINAAFIAASAGVDTVIASGKDAKALNALASGGIAGTLVSSDAGKINRKKHWLLFGMKHEGEIIADDGAIEAVTLENRSLLASGITGTRGDFKKGAGVYVVNATGTLFAKGVSNYSSRDIDKIKGLSSDEIKRKFGDKGFSSIIVHKDKMVKVEKTDNPLR